MLFKKCGNPEMLIVIRNVVKASNMKHECCLQGSSGLSMVSCGQSSPKKCWLVLSLPVTLHFCWLARSVVLHL